MKKTIFTPLIFLLFIIIAGTFILVNNSSMFFNNQEAKEQSFSGKFTIVGFHLFDLVPEEKKLENNNIIKEKGYKPDLCRGLDSVRVCLSKGDYSSAENELKNLLIFYPDNKTILSLLGGVFYLSGKYNQAIIVFSSLQKSYPDDPVIKENLGVQYEKKKNYKMAIREFNEALKVSESSSLSYIHLARLYSILGEKKEAMAYFQKAHLLLGEKILVFSYDPVFDNIRNMSEFVLIIHRYSK